MKSSPGVQEARNPVEALGLPLEILYKLLLPPGLLGPGWFLDLRLRSSKCMKPCT
jgi:hypothetical protein